MKVKKEYKHTLVINALAGPGSGKSTFSGGIFNLLKESGYNVEYVQEFAKTLTWEKNFEALKHQCYVTGTQQYMQNMLIGQVEAVITDSPILVGLMYYDEQNPRIRKAFTDYIVESFKEQNNLTFFIDRLKEYNPSGRNQSEEEAKEIDKRMLNLLRKYKIDYTTIMGNRSGLEEAFGIVRNILDENRRAE
jgi:nicotinamide riboside kinase